MLEEKLKKFKDFFALNKEENNKRKIENLVVFIVILIITIILINTIWNDDKKEKIQSNTDKVLAKSETADLKQDVSQNTELEERLQNILQNIQGVGKVKVLLTYSQSSQTLAMYNEDSIKSDTQETDTNGGSRKITESTIKKEVIYKEVDGEKIPVTQSVIKPKIEGAIITAVGAKNSDIKTSIVQAVEAATRTCNT